MSYKKISLRFILNIYSILLIVIPLLTVAIIADTLSRQQTGRQAINQMQSIGEAKVQEIRSWLRHSETILALTLTNLEQYRRIQDILISRGNVDTRRQNVQKFLSEQLALQTAFSELFFFNEQGLIRVSTDSTRVGISIKTQPYFTLELDSARVQPPYYDPERQRMTSLILQPIYHPGGYVLGVMAGRLNTETLNQIMTNRIGLGETGETYLVSQAEQRLLTPSRLSDYGGLTEPQQSVALDLALTNEQSGAGFYDNYDDRPVVGVYLWLPELKAALLAEIETVEAFSALNQAQLVNSIILLIAVIIAIALGMVVTGRLVGPLKRLTQVATAVMNGDYERRANLKAVAEMGQLAQAFDTMTDQLVKSLAERNDKINEVQELSASLEQRVAEQTEGVRTVAQFSERLNAILNVNELMAAVVNRIQTAFNYYHAHIYLLNEPGDVLQMMEGTGPVGEELKRRNHQIALNHPHSLVAKAAREQQLVLVDNVRHSPDWLPNELLPKTQAEIAVPILQEGQMIGVLDVQSEQVAGLDKGDAYLLRLLANQTGVALNNARLYENLATLNHDKDRFFSIMAHDLKSPFQPVLGNAEFLAEMGDSLSGEKVKQIGQDMHRSGRRVLGLLESLLQWASLQMGRMEFHPEPMNVAHIAGLSVELLNDNAVSKQIRLENAVPTELTACADKNMVDTIIRNLTNNALKFTPTGGQVTISAQADSGFVTVSVADTGVGMSAEVQAKLFQIGVHHSTAGTANESGTGLGLIICQEMVQLNGGQIWRVKQGRERHFDSSCR